MPLFQNNGNGITIPKWLLPIVITLFITSMGAWATISFQARAALPRDEAYQRFVTTETLEACVDRWDKRQERMEDKLDRLLER